jgi:hypothetical protein
MNLFAQTTDTTENSSPGWNWSLVALIAVGVIAALIGIWAYLRNRQLIGRPPGIDGDIGISGTAGMPAGADIVPVAKREQI